MREMRTQEERLDWLLEQFLAENAEHLKIPAPAAAEGKRRLLRSLMNVRPPKPLPEEVRAVQDVYLRERAAERGVVRTAGIAPVSETLGSSHPGADRICVWQGDITLLDADAVVNAANSEMLGCFVPCHSCIDNCIHTYAGTELRQECGRQMGLLRERFGADYVQPTAVPMLTDAYNLPAKKVIHIVGPIVADVLTREHEQKLAECYRNTLDLCAEEGLRTVAFCCISTGVFRFPNERAAEIAVGTVTDWLAEHEGIVDCVIFNVFKDEDKYIYERILS